ncbi:MAG: XRE family transcriptional regulator [Gemmatimonadales bacterium]|nr:MAG: XRE family transcriptional regulator [Gemmatimonadales bacterium]
MPLGENLRRIRTERGLSQSELGEMAGLHQSVISNLERNVHSPRLETLKRVAGALELSVPGLTMAESESEAEPD